MPACCCYLVTGDRGEIRKRAAGLADALKREPGVEVQLIDGDKGELTVLVDGEVVARKGDAMPEAAEVLDAVHEAGSVANAGGRAAREMQYPSGSPSNFLNRRQP